VRAQTSLDLQSHEEHINSFRPAALQQPVMSGVIHGVQDRYSPHGICFGCGPANKQGLRIKSDWEGDKFVARWRPQPKQIP
jgi:hypothetical protein